MLKRIIKQFYNKHKSLTNLNFKPHINQQRVLISYITKQFEIDFNSEPIGHTNLYEVNIIIDFFLKRDFIIDVVYCNDNYFIKKTPNKQYDIVFGFGQVFRHFVRNSNKALKIIYCTENAPTIAFHKELERVSNYNLRNFKNIKTERAYTYYLDDDFKASDYAIVLQNEFNLKNFSDLVSTEKTFTLQPSGLLNTRFKQTRSIINSKNNFVWIGSRGVIHKGLDLLVEVFKDTPNLILHVMGLNNKEKHLLPKRLPKNIIIHGFVDVQTERFNSIMNKSSFCVLPSCSEAMATSVLTGMRHGLVPVITRETGIDIDGVGFYFESIDLDYLRSRVIEIANTKIRELELMHLKVIETANSKYNLVNFENRFNEIMDKIILK